MEDKILLVRLIVGRAADVAEGRVGSQKRTPLLAASHGSFTMTGEWSMLLRIGDLWRGSAARGKSAEPGPSGLTARSKTEGWSAFPVYAQRFAQLWHLS